MDKQVATKLISDRLDKAYALLRECVAVSEDSGVAFYLPWGGEGTAERGMGAEYVPGSGWISSAGTC